MSIQLTSTESSTARSNVTIVGGGPAGLATALMLAKRGWMDITVLEQRTAADYYEPDKSYNYLIDGRGQQLTDLLGLTESLADLGVSNAEFYLTRILPNGKCNTFKVPTVNPNRITAYWLPRRVFLRLLYEEIERNWQDRITVLFETKCMKIERLATDRGTQRLEVIAHRAPDAIERFEPSLLVGCDGLQSLVRTTLHQWEQTDRFEMHQFPSPSSGLKYKVLSLPPNFPLNDKHQDRAVATMAYAIKGKGCDGNRPLSLGVLPFKDDTLPRTANIITYPDHHIWSLKTGDRLLQFLEREFPQLPIREIVPLAEADRFAQSAGGAFPVPQFCHGLAHLLTSQSAGGSSVGILLLGDAVHCFPPDIGQGVNSALEDVVVFDEVLSQSQDDLTQALPLYEQRRSPDTTALVRIAQTAAPWQYNQNRWRSRLWVVQFFLRLGISRILTIVSPPAFFLIQDRRLSYREIWEREQRGDLILKVLGAIALLAGGIGITNAVVH